MDIFRWIIFLSLCTALFFGIAKDYPWSKRRFYVVFGLWISTILWFIIV